MEVADQDKVVRRELSRYAAETGLNVQGGKIRRTSSRFCLGVEHGDYNGTELFGVGTDRFIHPRENVAAGTVRHATLFFPRFSIAYRAEEPSEAGLNIDADGPCPSTGPVHVVADRAGSAMSPSLLECGHQRPKREPHALQIHLIGVEGAEDSLHGHVPSNRPDHTKRAT